jgi:hypothetical protein
MMDEGFQGHLLSSLDRVGLRYTQQTGICIFLIPFNSSLIEEFFKINKIVKNDFVNGV